jgi:hypothetical protein
MSDGIDMDAVNFRRGAIVTRPGPETRRRRAEWFAQNAKRGLGIPRYEVGEAPRPLEEAQRRERNLVRAERAELSEGTDQEDEATAQPLPIFTRLEARFVDEPRGERGTLRAPGLTRQRIEDLLEERRLERL